MFMSKKSNRIITFLMCVVLLTVSNFSAFALISGKIEDEIPPEQEAAAQQSVFAGGITICTNKGLHSELPENSLSAVVAAPSDVVSVDVKLTKDGVPVLMEDETVDRMCVDSNGDSVSGRVDSYTFEEISGFYLKKRSGGAAEKSDTKVSSLSDVFNVAASKIIVVDVRFEDLDEVLEIANTDSTRSRAVLRIDGKPDKIIDKLSGEDKVPNVILKYDGNIIFSVNSVIKKAAKSGINLVQLGTKNHHGVIFYKSVEKKIKSSNLTAAFSMTEPYNARRQDNTVGWDDAVSHGFTFIETDYPELLTRYVNECENTKDDLKSLINKCSVYDGGNYPKDLKYEFNKAYDNAVETAGRASSLSQLGNALTALSKAAEALDRAENTSTVSSVFHFSAGRIVAVVLCLAAVTAAQIYFYKRRQKQKQ